MKNVSKIFEKLKRKDAVKMKTRKTRSILPVWDVW